VAKLYQAIVKVYTGKQVQLEYPQHPVWQHCEISRRKFEAHEESLEVRLEGDESLLSKRVLGEVV
jgi:hypothetical protein